MTHPGPKRPLEVELPLQPAAGASIGVGGDDAGSIGSNLQNGLITNGNKRRCNTNSLHHQSTTPMRADTPFKDSSVILTPLSDDIAAVIQDSIQRNNITDQEKASVVDDDKLQTTTTTTTTTPLLTIRQTQLICEKLIKDREQRLKDEYDRVLACKLAEQYDLLSKANYINSSYDHCSSRANSIPSPAQSAPTTPQQQHQQQVHHHTSQSSINALAAAFMQRTAAAAAAAAAAANNAATNSIPDLTTFAASLTANGHPSTLTTTHLAAFNLQQQAANAAAAMQHVQQQQHHHQHQQQQQRISAAAIASNTIPSGPVLLASNLDEQLATPEALFTLFGVFGDVIRVKILFNKKDNALIQMADSNQAKVAQGYLDKQKVFGKIIRVTRSKHQLVQMPREGNQSDAGLTKDFTNSPLHRFKIPGSRNYLNIYPPSSTLHISNIPATIEEKDIQKAFKEACGFEFSYFKFFPKDRKMALMKFNTIEHATIALIKMHNFQISDDNNLRVSFSKSAMQS